MVLETKPKIKTLEINFHAGQMKAWNELARFVAVLAGAQGGKTMLGSPWLHREISNRGGGDYLAVTANYDLFKLKMLPALLEYFVETLRVGRYWASDKVIELCEELKYPPVFWAKESSDKMWGRIILRSAESTAGLESATAKAAWLDEAGHDSFKREAWEAAQRRLSLNQGRALFTTTLYNWGWLKNEVYDRWVNGDKDYSVIQFDSIDNPKFPKEEYEREMRTLPKWKFDMFYRGIYTRPAGIIYDCFNPIVCKLTRFEMDKRIQKDWPRYVGHDFGPIHTSALWYAQEPLTGYMYLYRTYKSHEKTTAPAHVAKWKELSGDEPIVRRVGGAVGSADEGWRQAYEAAGWSISEPTIKDVEVGIDRVYAWHKTDRLFVADDLYDYLDEKMSYSRKLDSKYQPIENEIKDKATYHLMDGERYILSDFQPVETAIKQTSSGIRVTIPGVR